MIEIISAEMVARETIKNEIEEDIPFVNEAICNAKENGETSCRVNESISRATIELLEDAGYYVDWETNETYIEWTTQYNELSEDYDTVKEIADEIGVKIVEVEKNRNTIDPNWEPPRKD